MKRIKDHLLLGSMCLFLLAVQVIALLLVDPLNAQHMQAFEDPQSILNPIWYMGMILAFTLFMLLIIKLDLRWVIRLIILVVVAFTLYLVFFVILSMIAPPTTSFIGSIMLTTALTLLLYKYPEWYIIDITGILIGAGAAAMFGISLAILPTLILLIILAVYDAIAVYQTKHMVMLAEGMLDLRTPILFIIPKRWGYSFLDQTPKDEKNAYFIGLGDVVVPTVLVVSAKVFIISTRFVNLPALGAIIGSLVGFAALIGLSRGEKPQAGLPFLNTGTILGFMIGYFLQI
ncbi:MAG: presenilin family intramembrane aspartyl protease [Methanocellales archaeon]|nr:presenilin family intramembrane aspartyl protease [Methanocellales archaeon]MDD3421293.1 presenilin family intramembrane aspartyl protease [Methanocellales archaeon]MDD4898478.1 presenilin family intramembrane aspartyl protease [Methanocellales archaeon]MDD5447231.1 presenilin family intramembrane aspartyl protease [Methanocellales archaeon]